MSNFDMNGMLALMTMLSGQQGQNLETVLKPRGRIAQSPKNNSASQFGASGIQGQYDWEAQKRQNTTNQMQEMVTQQKLKNEMNGLRGGQPQQQQQQGFLGFLGNLFSGGNNQPQGQPQGQPQNNNTGWRPKFYVQGGVSPDAYDANGVPKGYENVLFQGGLPSEKKKSDGWDWNDMPGGRPTGMPENPTAPEINKKTGTADYDPYARGSMNLGMTQTQGQLNKRGQKTVTYSPPQSRGTPYVRTQGAPKAQVVPGSTIVKPNTPAQSNNIPSQQGGGFAEFAQMLQAMAGQAGPPMIELGPQPQVQQPTIPQPQRPVNPRPNTGPKNSKRKEPYVVREKLPGYSEGAILLQNILDALNPNKPSIF